MPASPEVLTRPLLELSRVSLNYRVGQNSISALNDIAFSIGEREILGVVGESGSGKSTLSSFLLRLLPDNAEVQSGSVKFAGEDVLQLSEREMRKLRGGRIGMIFQDPLSSLHPCLTIGRQFIDAQNAHFPGSKKADLRHRAERALTQVGIPDALERLDDFPHEFSGGMRQRIMIALALMLNPKLLIADEPTSALDVTLQAQIIELLRRIRDDFSTAVMFISHDLGIVSEIADRIVVMYAGQVVEDCATRELFDSPLHPYSAALLSVVPRRQYRGRQLATIPGRVPSFLYGDVACRFANRCQYAEQVCRSLTPSLTQIGTRYVRCHLHVADSGHSQAQSGHGRLNY